jgi:Fur family transcriptional regulator, ferric uptake regulator
MKRRNTPVKEALLELLEHSDSALSQDMIEQRLSISADKVTIYRMLNRFCEDGITHRAVSEEGKNYYALCKECSHEKHTHDHFHFRCLNCGRVECLHNNVIVSLPKGYKATNMNCWISGYCSSCID